MFFSFPLSFEAVLTLNDLRALYSFFGAEQHNLECHLSATSGECPKVLSAVTNA